MANISQLVELYADLLAIPRRIVGKTAMLLGQEGMLPAGRRGRRTALGAGDAATLLLASAWVGRSGTPSAAAARLHASLPCRAIRLDGVAGDAGQPAAALTAIRRPLDAAALRTVRRPEDLAALESPIYALALAIWDAADPRPGGAQLVEISIRRDPESPAARITRDLGATGQATAWYFRGTADPRRARGGGPLREVVEIAGTMLPEIARLLTADDVLLSDAALRWLPLADLLSGVVPAPIDPARPTDAEIDAARVIAEGVERGTRCGPELRPAQRLPSHPPGCGRDPADQ